ncbi:cation diffusion facilitator family transporter [Sphingobium sp. CR28]|uniref:cation diffusion facilitator family transporter n=1 Tax=Sphingobium sp. CR28 TaxID=3400272 RepID=UPI003FF0F9BA
MSAPQERGALTAQTSATLRRRAALASVCAAIILGAAKSYAAWTTHSIAMLGSLADTTLDLVASLVTLFAVRIAAQPADYEHRFGHGKAEALAALFQMVLVTIAAGAIIFRSVERLGGGAAPAAFEDGVVVSVFAIVLTIALVRYQMHVVRATGSIAIHADNLHYRSDLALNGAVIAALVLDGWAGLHGADALFGILIGLWLGWTALRASMQAIDQLMDKEWPIEKRERLLTLAARHPMLAGIHDLRTRTSGTRDFVQFHLWMEPELTLARVHAIMEEIEAMLRAEFPHTDFLIHPDPVGHIDGTSPLVAQDARDVVAEEKAANP